MLSENVGTDIFQKPQSVDKNLDKGLMYKYYEGEVKNTHMISELPTIKSGLADNITTSHRNRDVNYAFIFSGYIKIHEDGVYTALLR